MMQNTKQKTAKQLEKHLKGIANHRRIDILFVIAKNEGITLEKIAEILKCNMKTTSQHTRKLADTGLIRKRYCGQKVLHNLSPYGRVFYSFLKAFQARKTFLYSAEY